MANSYEVFFLLNDSFAVEIALILDEFGVVLIFLQHILDVLNRETDVLIRSLQGARTPEFVNAICLQKRPRDDAFFTEFGPNGMLCIFCARHIALYVSFVERGETMWIFSRRPPERMSRRSLS